MVYKFDVRVQLKMNQELIDLMEVTKDILVKQGKARPNRAKFIRHSIRKYCNDMIKKDREQQEVTTNG